MSNEENILNEWCVRITRSHRAHKKAAAFYETQGRRLGKAATFFSAIVGTSVFLSLLEDSVPISVKVGAGLLSICAAVFATLQTYLNYPELAQNHSKAATNFGDLRRRIEILEEISPTDDELKNSMVALDKDWGTLNERAPIITQKLYDKTDSEIDSQSIK